MTVLLVRKTNCPDCKEPVEVSYTEGEFEKKFENSYELPWGNTTPRDAFNLLKHSLFENVYCVDCCERRRIEAIERRELNEEYWENYYISNPRD